MIRSGQLPAIGNSSDKNTAVGGDFLARGQRYALVQSVTKLAHRTAYREDESGEHGTAYRAWPDDTSFTSPRQQSVKPQQSTEAPTDVRRPVGFANG